MKRSEQIQETVDEFHRESDLRKLKFHKTLQYVYMPFVVPCLVMAYLSYRLGNYISAFVFSSIGLALPISTYWFIPTYPEKFIESKEPEPLKKKILFWVGVIVLYCGLWFFR